MRLSERAGMLLQVEYGNARMNVSMLKVPCRIIASFHLVAGSAAEINSAHFAGVPSVATGPSDIDAHKHADDDMVVLRIS